MMQSYMYALPSFPTYTYNEQISQGDDQQQLAWLPLLLLPLLLLLMMNGAKQCLSGCYSLYSDSMLRIA